MTKNCIYFETEGVPVTQGSMKSFARMIRGKMRAVTTHEKGPKLKEWRNKIAADARAAMTLAGRETPVKGPVIVSISFFFERPKGHFLASGKLNRKAALEFPRKGDLDKYFRAAGDALTGIVYVDDKQVTRIITGKYFREKPGAKIFVKFKWEE